MIYPQQLFKIALDELVEEIGADARIIAAVLLGSMSHDVVWEKSDIDLLLITVDDKIKQSGMSLLKRDIIVHAQLMTRAEFRKAAASALQSSFMHSYLSRGRVLFTRDPTITSFFDQPDTMGARDRQIRLLECAVCILPSLTKAQKWLIVKQDYRYAFFYVTKMIDRLATLEVVHANGNPGREVVQQALAINPVFFNQVYTDLIDRPLEMETVGAAIDSIERYLLDRVAPLFGPLLDYLSAANSARSATEIDHYFANQMNIECVSLACEWLSDHNIVQRVGLSRRLTDKSRVDVEEAAFYYSAT
ncbi:MAG TPA: hypothetical protein VGK19_01295 [Capsulimonadaceae bacterium]|jgi:hypothetical protein